MKFILIFTLFLSTYSIGASSHADDSVWEEWSVTELANFLRDKSSMLNCFSVALQRSYANDHEDNIKQALTHLHQKHTQALESCAGAFYRTLLLQNPNTTTNSSAHSTLLPRKPLPLLDESELFKNGKFHPDFARLVKKHCSRERSTYNTRLIHEQDYLPFIACIRNIYGEIIYMEIPLYIINKSSHQFTHTHISKRNAKTLIPKEGTPSFLKSALSTTHTGAIFIFAKISFRSLFNTLSFSAYETKASPTARLKARPKDKEFSKTIEQGLDYLAKMLKKAETSSPQKHPEPSPSTTSKKTPDITRQEPPTGVLINF